MRRLIYILPLALFAIVGAVFYFGFSHDPREIPSALIGQPVPQFDLPPLPGHAKGLASADLTGDVQIVNVWASWCVPCKAEHPIISRLAHEAKIPVRGINWKDKPEAALAWLKTNGDPFTSIGADPDNHVAVDWGVYGVPESFVIDRKGVIRYKVPGPLTPSIVEEEILPLVEKLRKE